MTGDKSTVGWLYPAGSRSRMSSGDTNEFRGHKFRGHNTQLQPRRLSQRLVKPGLPARPAGAEMVDHRLVEAERDEALGRAGRAAAADDLVADAEGRLFEPLVGEFRRVVRINPGICRIVAVHVRWPSASK